MDAQPSNINDIPDKALRRQLQEALYERSFLAYSLSYRLLMEALVAAGMDLPEINDIIKGAVLAWDDKEEKAVKDGLNDYITKVYTENGIDKTLRHFDPFGRRKDFIMMEGTATSFSKDRAIQLAVAGIYEWECPECQHRQFSKTLKVKCKSEGCDYESEKVPHYTPHRIPADVITAVLELATTQTTYLSLQARDVKDVGDGPAPYKPKGGKAKKAGK